MPVFWWKVPTFFWIGLRLQPLLSSCPLAQQPTFSPVLPPQYRLRQHDFRASQGSILAAFSEAQCWAVEKAAQEKLCGGRLCHAQCYRGTSRSALKGETVFCAGTPQSRCPATNARALQSLTGRGQSWQTRRRGTHAGVWFHHAKSPVDTSATPSYIMLPHAFLNTAEDTAGLNPKRGKMQFMTYQRK